MVTKLNNPERWQRQQDLAATVRQRRLDLGLSLRAAADQAGVARGTWMALEGGNRVILANNHAAIERVLQWTSGRIARLLEDGDSASATTSEEVEKRGHAAVPVMDDAVERIYRSNLPAEKKLQIIRMMLAERQRAEERLLQLADELVALAQNSGEKPST
ncbi:hypothetical protein [Actinoplanes solisilvae]|uniref:hypothetical protein n=1 Tax=Actinoplanes solisilvae TaxID=2486853 RepID=UPI000FD854C8|nr:hypothetical protein [Actinoplanes solisilvae]